MNRPSLYAAFGDKRELYLKTLEHYRDEYRALARRTLADDPPLRVLLKRFYDAALDIYLAGEGGPRGCYSIGTAATEATVDPNVRAFLADSTRTTDAFLKSRIDKARERGEIAHDADTDGARLPRDRDDAHARDPLARRTRRARNWTRSSMRRSM